MADLRMVHALGLEIPSRRLLERHSQMQRGFAVGNEAGVYPALRGSGPGGFNGVRNLGGNAHLGARGYNVFVVPGVMSDSDTENEDIDSEISTECGDPSILSIYSIHSIHSEGCQQDKSSGSTASLHRPCGAECQEADGTNGTDSKEHGHADSKEHGGADSKEHGHADSQTVCK